MPIMQQPNIADLENIEFWKSLNPCLSITSTPFLNDSPDYELDANGQSLIRQQIIEEGYFQTPSIVSLDEIEKLRNAIICLNASNVAPVFVAVYDEFWILLRSLRKTFATVLQENYRLVPDFWVWHIDTDDQSTGWKPHRDGNMWSDSIRDDGTPTLCTAWIALSDIETSNSCMYVLPRKYDAIFQDFARKRAGQPGIDNAAKIPIPLTRIRALPVKAGAILGWDTNLYHWGSGSSRWASEPRISIGVYYEATDAKEKGMPYSSDGKRFVDYSEQDSPLTFENRLVIIANIIDNYMHKFDNDGETEKGFTPEVTKFKDKWLWKG